MTFNGAFCFFCFCSFFGILCMACMACMTCMARWLAGSHYSSPWKLQLFVIKFKLNSTIQCHPLVFKWNHLLSGLQSNLGILGIWGSFVVPGSQYLGLISATLLSPVFLPEKRLFGEECGLISQTAAGKLDYTVPQPTNLESNFYQGKQ